MALVASAIGLAPVAPVKLTIDTRDAGSLSDSSCFSSDNAGLTSSVSTSDVASSDATTPTSSPSAQDLPPFHLTASYKLDLDTVSASLAPLMTPKHVRAIPSFDAEEGYTTDADPEKLVSRRITLPAARRAASYRRAKPARLDLRLPSSARGHDASTPRRATSLVVSSIRRDVEYSRGASVNGAAPLSADHEPDECDKSTPIPQSPVASTSAVPASSVLQSSFAIRSTIQRDNRPPNIELPLYTMRSRTPSLPLPAPPQSSVTTLACPRPRPAFGLPCVSPRPSSCSPVPACPTKPRLAPTSHRDLQTPSPMMNLPECGAPDRVTTTPLARVPFPSPATGSPVATPPPFGIMRRSSLRLGRSLTPASLPAHPRTVRYGELGCSRHPTSHHRSTSLTIVPASHNQATSLHQSEPTTQYTLTRIRSTSQPTLPSVHASSSHPNRRIHTTSPTDALLASGRLPMSPRETTMDEDLPVASRSWRERLMLRPGDEVSMVETRVAALDMNGLALTTTPDQLMLAPTANRLTLAPTVPSLASASSGDSRGTASSGVISPEDAHRLVQEGDIKGIVVPLLPFNPYFARAEEAA